MIPDAVTSTVIHTIELWRNEGTDIAIWNFQGGYHSGRNWN